jgi:hypothetical protein
MMCVYCGAAINNGPCSIAGLGWLHIYDELSDYGMNIYGYGRTSIDIEDVYRGWYAGICPDCVVRHCHSNHGPGTSIHRSEVPRMWYTGSVQPSLNIRRFLLGQYISWYPATTARSVQSQYVSNVYGDSGV